MNAVNPEYMNDFMLAYDSGFSILTNVISLVLSTLGTWKIFEKVGIEGWKALIPFYREYLLFDLAKQKKSSFWIYIGSQIGLFISSFGMGFTVGIGIVSSSTIFAIIGLFFLLVMLISVIVMLVYLIRTYYKLFLLFEKEKGLACVLAIFSNIGLLITGFDHSVYQGNGISKKDEMSNGINIVESNEKIHFCSNCGSKVDGNFCSNCGNKIE